MKSPTSSVMIPEQHRRHPAGRPGFRSSCRAIGILSGLERFHISLRLHQSDPFPLPDEPDDVDLPFDEQPLPRFLGD